MITLDRSENLYLKSKKADVKNYVTSFTFPEKVEKTLSQLNPSIIINCIANTNVDNCESDPRNAFFVNAEIAKQLADWANLNKKKLIFISSDQVYFGEGLHHEENVSPINYYSYSKYIGELLSSRTQKHVILRTNFFGLSPIKERPSFTDWLYNCYLEKRRIQLFSDIYFSPVSIHTLCEIIFDVIRKNIHGCFNVGSNNGMSKAKFAIKFFKYLDIDPYDFCVLGSHKQQAHFTAKRPNDMRLAVKKIEAMIQRSMPDLDDEILKVSFAYKKGEKLHDNK